MSTLRTHFTFRVDTWTPDGESIVEHIAGVEDYQVALATYRAACERWPGTPITLRQGARVIEDSRRTRPPPGPTRVVAKAGVSVPLRDGRLQHEIAHCNGWRHQDDTTPTGGGQKGCPQ